MLTFAVEKSIKTVTTYRVLSFHGENKPFEDSLLCHKFECGPRHFDKQLCKLAGNTRHPGSQLKWQIKPRAPRFCLISCLAACALVRIIRVRVRL